MNPTFTDRRHFFLFSYEEQASLTLDEILIDSGYHKSDVLSNAYVGGSSEILLLYSESSSFSSYIGGIISPNREISQQYAKKGRFVTAFGHLFLLLFLIYVLEWSIAFLALGSAFAFVFDYLGYIMAATFIAFLIFAALFSISFVHLDRTASQVNYNLMQNAIGPFIGALTSAFPRIKITRLAVPTRLGERRIGFRMPNNFVRLLYELGCKDMEKRFWA
jgi:hypothetical protein